MNDDESIVVDSDPEKVPISAEKSSKASKNEPKRYKPQSEIMQFFCRWQPSQLVEPTLTEKIPSEKTDKSKQWTDWKAKAQREKQQKREEERRKKQGRSSTDQRRSKIIKNLINSECERSCADISVEENKADIAARILKALEPPQKVKKVDDAGNALSSKEIVATKIFHGQLDTAFRRKFGAEDSLYLWDRFMKYHGFGESKTKEAKHFALYGSDKCDWVTIAARIARDEPDRFGSGHPCAVELQAVKRSAQDTSKQTSASKLLHLFQTSEV